MAAMDEKEDEFLEQVDKVSALVDGLKKGSISVEQVDQVAQNELMESNRTEADEGKQKESANTSAAIPSSVAHAHSIDDLDEQTRTDVREKARLWKLEFDRRQRAQEKLQEYLQRNPSAHSHRRVAPVDYAKWELWEPSDNEDDPQWVHELGAKPPGAEADAIERDVAERRDRQVKRRQNAYRKRVHGNELLHNGQPSAALREYEDALALDKRSIELHSNAAKACNDIGAHAQAIEHCNSALQVADFLLEQPRHHVALKALTRRARAHQMLGHLEDASVDLDQALKERCQSGTQRERVSKHLREVNDQIEAQQASKRTKAVHDTPAYDDRGSSTNDNMLRARQEDMRKVLDRYEGEAVNIHDLISKELHKLTDSCALSDAKIQWLEESISGSSEAQARLREEGTLSALMKAVDNVESDKPSREDAIARIIRSSTDSLRAARADIASNVRMCQRLWHSHREHQLSLLHELSLEEDFGEQIAQHLLSHPQRQQVVSSLADQAECGPLYASTLANLALCESGRSALVVECVPLHALKAVCRYKRENATNDVVRTNVSLIANASADKQFRSLLARSQWKVDGMTMLLTIALHGSTDVVDDALAAMANTLLDTTLRDDVAKRMPSAVRDLVCTYCACCTNQTISETEMLRAARAMTVSSRLLRAENAQYGAATDSDTINIIMKTMQQNNSLADGAASALATLVQGSLDVMQASAEKDIQSALSAAIVKCLSDVDSESARGNAALIASNLAKESNVREHFRKHKALQRLLDEARIQSSAIGRKNAAIACAKLASTDSHFLNELRELGGIELIYKYVDPHAR